MAQPLPSGGWSGLFAAAFRQSKNAMALVEEDRTIVDVNGSLLALLGYSRSAMVGHPVWEFVLGGPRVLPPGEPSGEPAALSERQREIVQLVRSASAAPRSRMSSRSPRRLGARRGPRLTKANRI
jgi:PAS domain-containing protein